MNPKNKIYTTPENLPYHCAAFFPNNIQIENAVLMTRGRVGKYEHLTFYINQSEPQHNSAHVHVRNPSKQEIPINILTCKIEVSDAVKINFPKKDITLAIKYIKEHQEELISEWNKYHPELRVK